MDKLFFDILLWVRWFDYFRAIKKCQQMSRVITKAICFQPSSFGVWLYVSVYELKQKGNTQTSRSLIQHGLRECKKFRYLWVNYFRFELLLVRKLIKKYKIFINNFNCESQYISDRIDENLKLITCEI